MGKVYLVGAGPGSPDLLTLRAAEILKRAELVFHDSLVHPQTLALAARARKILVGKRSGRHSTAQRFINKRLVDAARPGGNRDAPGAAHPPRNAGRLACTGAGDRRRPCSGAPRRSAEGGERRAGPRREDRGDPQTGLNEPVHAGGVIAFTLVAREKPPRSRTPRTRRASTRGC